MQPPNSHSNIILISTFIPRPWQPIVEPNAIFGKWRSSLWGDEALRQRGQFASTRSNRSNHLVSILLWEYPVAHEINVQFIVWITRTSTCRCAWEICMIIMIPVDLHWAQRRGSEPRVHVFSSYHIGSDIVWVDILAECEAPCKEILTLNQEQ